MAAILKILPGSYFLCYFSVHNGGCVDSEMLGHYVIYELHQTLQLGNPI